MLPQIFLLIAFTTIIGFCLIYFKLLTFTEAGITGFVTLGLLLLIVLGGWNIFKADKLSFNEYWNGYETQANWLMQDCSRDSGCGYTYNCDPYQVAHTYTTTDSKGNSTTHTYYTTEYHHCPYVTQEWVFNIDTSLGNYHIARNIPDNPTEYRIGSGFGPGTRGVPAFWQAAYDRIAAGKPGPVTKRMQYDNYLLASDKSILNQYSDQIAQLDAEGLLPKVSHDTFNFYYANKVYFAKVAPPDGVDKWELALSYLNAGLGTELQGDLHLVVVPNTMQPDSFITALKAYWSNPAVFGDDAISKNSIIVAIGTDGTKVQWARAVTGMPLGNEYMLARIKDTLEDQPLTADAIIGQVSSEFYKSGEKTKARSTVSSGALYKVIWGIDDPASKFKRISMSGGSTEDNGSGFGYLKDEIQPSDFQQLLIFVISLIIVSLTWTLAYGIKISDSQRSRYGYYS